MSFISSFASLLSTQPSPSTTPQRIHHHQVTMKPSQKSSKIGTARGRCVIEPLESRVAPAALVFANHDASGFDTRVPLATDSAGNIIVAGVFDGEITLNGGGTSILLQTQEIGGPGVPIGSDLYVAKYSAAGRLLWATSWGGVPFGGAFGFQEIAEDVAVNGAGDVFLLATFRTQNAGIDGAGSISATGGPFEDTVVLKFNGSDGRAATSFGNQGALVWGGSGADTGGAIVAEGPMIFFTGSYNSADARLGAVAGYAAATGGSDAYVIAVSSTDGAPVGSFGSQGLVALPSGADEGAFDLAVDVASNSVFVATKGQTGDAVAKFTLPNGIPGTTFGIGGRLLIPNLAAIAVDSIGRLLATGGIENPGGYLKRFEGANGTLDNSFAGDGTADLGTSAQRGLSIATDSAGSVYLAGAKSVKPGVPSPYFIAKFKADGSPDDTFGSNGRFTFANSGNGDRRDISMVVGPDGYIQVRGLFSGTTDIDPTEGVTTVVAAIPGAAAGHADLDTFLANIDPNGVDPSNALSFTDQSGDTVRFTFKGAGRLSVTPGTTPGVDIERIEAFDTDATTKLSIGLSGGALGTTTIAHIITPGAQQHIGILKLGKNVTLGSGNVDLDPALEITGATTKIILGNVNANALIRLGAGLPYDVTGDDTTPDSYNNRPPLLMRNVLGNGVVIEVTGDGTPSGTGGGGLGRILVDSWTGTGVIKTTQSILSYRQKTGDCNVVFEVDKLGNGTGTRADMGSITILGGSWGSSGTEIEGNCGSFSCASFLAGATITAGNINTLLVKSGPYAGTVTLTNPSAGALKTFKVASDFAGYVSSANSIINIKVAGDFKGSLVAASIGKIQAFSFDGTTTGDLYKDPLRHQIIAQSGSLGTIATKGGGIKNFEIEALTVIGGVSVATSSAGTSTSLTGLDNVTIIGAQIGSTKVALKPSIGAGPITLLAMQDVIYDMESTIGKITASHSIVDSQLSAGTDIDKIAVGSATFPTEGISGSKFLAGSNLGGDGAIDGDETWTRSGIIKGITVYGPMTQTTLSAGINPVNGIFGDVDDALGSGGAGLSESIGSIKLGAGSGTAVSSPGLTHDWVIQGDTLKDLKINSIAVVLTSGLPKYLQIGGTEAASDILVRRL